MCMCKHQLETNKQTSSRHNAGHKRRLYCYQHIHFTDNCKLKLLQSDLYPKTFQFTNVLLAFWVKIGTLERLFHL